MSAVFLVAGKGEGVVEWKHKRTAGEKDVFEKAELDRKSLHPSEISWQTGWRTENPGYRFAF